jgi:hypothetical protein
MDAAPPFVSTCSELEDMAAISKDGIDQFRVRFGELAKVRRGEPVQIDPYLIAQAIGAVMRECTVRSAAGKPIVWNEYRMILARKDFDPIRPLQAPLERDLKSVLAREADARKAELVGELRVTVVFDEADELPPAEGVVRVAFVPTEKLASPRDGEMTMRLDAWAAAGEIVPASQAKPGSLHLGATAPKPGTDTVIVDESVPGGRCTVFWAGGTASLPLGATVVLGRPHPDSPRQFVPLTGAGSTVNKQHLFLVAGPAKLRIGRFPKANPVHVNGTALGAGDEIEVARPVEISLSRGDFVLTIR